MNKVIQVIIQFVVNAVFGIFTPIDNYILVHLPSLTTPIAYVNNFFNWLKDFVLWVLSWLPFNSNIWSWFISYLILRITISAFLSIIKIGVKWYHYLVP